MSEDILQIVLFIITKLEEENAGLQIHHDWQGHWSFFRLVIGLT